MKTIGKRQLFIGAGLLAVFALWTVLIATVDVRPIGPQGLTVGLATLNGAFHRLTGVHLWLYTQTDWLSLVPLAFVLAFALLGLIQFIQRKHLLRVDRDILALGVLYCAVMAIYLLFEIAVINYRPVLINGQPEASYPSSTTVLVLCVMPTAAMLLHRRIKCRTLRCLATLAIAVFTAFMVLGRLFSGVHWLTDIIAGALLSAGLTVLYDAARGAR